MGLQVSFHWSHRDRLAALLRGELDRNTVPTVRKRLLKMASNRRVRGMVVDLSAVSALDTAGVALLVELWKVLQKRHTELQLTGMQERVRRMIRLARLDQAFGLVADGE